MLGKHLHLRVVGHEVSWENESARNARCLNVLLNVGFTVEVRNVLQLAARRLGDIEQR